ncbi:MAG: tetratricopeptide repeat protein [Pseudomonadota bacterium]
MLSACQSEEVQISKFMDSGQMLMADGDHLRAMVQFRNVLKLDPDHVEASASLASILLETGDVFAAQQEFTGLAERFPEDIAWRRALGEIALIRSDWAALDRHAKQAQAIDPDLPAAQVLDLASAYRDAHERTDDARMVLIAREAQTLLEQAPDDTILLRIVVEHMAERDNPTAALPILDAALARNPRQPELQVLRIRLLADDRQLEAAEDRLLALAALYPQDLDIASILVARHMSNGDPAAAETVLRGLADAAPRAETGLRVTLVRFLKHVYGEDAAMAEIQRLATQADGLPAAALYQAMDRMLRYDQGQVEGAETDLLALVDGVADSAEALHIRVLIARLKERAGDQGAARAEIEEVLVADPGNVPALKLQATWMLEQEDTKPAIVALRTARAQAPRDTEIMSLLAAAHALDGDNALAMEQLATAALASGHGPRESERYARALLSDGRLRVAQRVLEAGHENTPSDVQLAATLAGIYVRQQNWPRARSILAHLSQLGSRAAEDALAPLEVAILEGEEKREEGFAMLDALLIDGPEDRRPVILVVQSLMRLGQTDVARAYVDRALVTNPNDLALRMLDASVRHRTGDLAGAEDLYRQAVAESVTDLAAQQLFLLLMEQGRSEDATAALADGLDRFPTSRPLRVIETSRREAEGDVSGAIDLLKDLHREDPTDMVVVNNLASLLAVHTTHPADLALAIKLAALLKTESVPAVADTVGWVAYRQGDLARAVPLLERAVRGLPNDPAIHLRLARAYVAVDRPDDASEVLGRVVALAGPDAPITQQAKTVADGLPRRVTQ